LIRTGQPRSRAAVSRVASEPSSPCHPGVTGTPAAIIRSRAESFRPMARMAAGEGPIQIRPAACTASAKAAVSDRKP